MLPALGKHKNVPTAKQIQFPHCPLNISLWQSSIKHWQTYSVNHTLSKARLIFSFNSPQRNLHVSVSSFSFSSKMSIGEEENLLIMFQIALWDKWRSLEASARQKVWTDGGLGGDMWTQFKVFLPWLCPRDGPQPHWQFLGMKAKYYTKHWSFCSRTGCNGFRGERRFP